MSYAVTYDVLECRLPRLMTREESITLTLEQWGSCPDTVDQGVKQIGILVGGLTESGFQYFQWN